MPSLFGVDYAAINQVITTIPAFMGNTIDPGSFADDGQTPPVRYNWTWSGGMYVTVMEASAVIGVTGTNPAYVPPTDDDSGND